MKQSLLVIAGAAIGGTLGFFAFLWVCDQGFRGWVIPGGFLGIGAGLARNRSFPLALICGIAALLLGFFSEWWRAPFLADESLAYFLLHVHKLPRLALLLIVLGGFVGFWIPYRSRQPSQNGGTPRN